MLFAPHQAQRDTDVSPITGFLMDIMVSTLLGLPMQVRKLSHMSQGGNANKIKLRPNFIKLKSNAKYR
jgi:hypothetical protein